ncbi:hypothetical protein AB0O22_18740 [Streptomyces sp. NPDC091204]|uniref:hypothetical protein n=1 Tax=Streptomyces sp. NPDC091204 TaxID=3155299 RepID=UPI00344909D9
MTPGSAEDNAADFLGRSPTARGEALLGRQSPYLTDPAERDHTRLRYERTGTGWERLRLWS